MATLGDATHTVEAGAAASLNVQIDEADLYLVNGSEGIGTTSPDGRLHTIHEDATTPVFENEQLYEGEGPTIETTSKGIIIRGSTNWVFSDGYGVEIVYEHEDSSGVEEVATLNTVRNGADDQVDIAISTANSGEPAEKVRITKAGDVGINTTTPGSMLELKTTGPVLPEILFNAAIYTMTTGVNTTGGYVNVTSNHALVLSTNNTEAARITNAQDLGIGDNAPTHRLSVKDNVAGYVAKFFNDGNDANNAGLHIQCGQDDGDAGTQLFITFYDGDGTSTGYLMNAADTLSITDLDVP